MCATTSRKRANARRSPRPDGWWRARPPRCCRPAPWTAPSGGSLRWPKPPKADAGLAEVVSAQQIHVQRGAQGVRLGRQGLARHALGGFVDLLHPLAEVVVVRRHRGVARDDLTRDAAGAAA